MLQFLRTPQLLVMGTVLGALFLVIFRYMFGGAVSTAATSTTSTSWCPGSSSRRSSGRHEHPCGVAEDAATGVRPAQVAARAALAVMLGRALADTGLVAWGLPSRPCSVCCRVPDPRRPRVHRRCLP